MGKTVQLRVDEDLIKEYQERHPETKRLSQTDIVDLMLRTLLEKEKVES